MPSYLVYNTVVRYGLKRRRFGSKLSLNVHGDPKSSTEEQLGEENKTKPSTSSSLKEKTGERKILGTTGNKRRFILRQVGPGQRIEVVQLGNEILPASLRISSASVVMRGGNRAKTTKVAKLKNDSPFSPWNLDRKLLTALGFGSYENGLLVAGRLPGRRAISKPATSGDRLAEDKIVPAKGHSAGNIADGRYWHTVQVVGPIGQVLSADNTGESEEANVVESAYEGADDTIGTRKDENTDVSSEDEADKIPDESAKENKEDVRYGNTESTRESAEDVKGGNTDDTDESSEDVKDGNTDNTGESTEGLKDENKEDADESTEDKGHENLSKNVPNFLADIIPHVDKIISNEMNAHGLPRPGSINFKKMNDMIYDTIKNVESGVEVVGFVKDLVKEKPQQNSLDNGLSIAQSLWDNDAPRGLIGKAKLAVKGDETITEMKVTEPTSVENMDKAVVSAGVGL